MRMQDQVPWSSNHPLLTDHTRCAPLVKIKYTGLHIVNASMESTV
jgi:hypothetical protein